MYSLAYVGPGSMAAPENTDRRGFCKTRFLATGEICPKRRFRAGCAATQEEAYTSITRRITHSVGAPICPSGARRLILGAAV